MNRSGDVHLGDRTAGRIEQKADGGYRFTYTTEYLALPDAKAVSLTLPLRSAPYESDYLFPFFSGMLAEGALKEIQCRLLHIDPNDDFTRLLKTTAHDVIGAVTVHEVGGAP